MSITILNPGMLTSVQDLGRIGYQQFGVSVSGVMDPRSASIANILVGNDEGEAVLECTMMGPHIRFDAPNIIAITGGDLGATLDGQRIDTYRAIPVNAGQTLRFTMLRTGCRAFVAFAGGLDIPVVMGSRSTNMKAKIGGYQGRKLQKDDVIGFRAPKTDLKNLGLRHTSPEFMPRAEYKLRIVLGPQDDAFTERGITTFLSSVYTLTPEFDRMGCRLDGELIEHVKSGDIISDGIAFGAVQVPSAGKPIIMLADRQTTGGDAKIGTIATVDIPKLVQRPPGSRVRFEPVTVQQAQELLRQEARQFEMLALKVRRPSADGISPRRTARRLTPILERQAAKTQADTLWIDRANRAERVGSRNALQYEKTPDEKAGADNAPQTASRGNGRTA